MTEGTHVEVLLVLHLACPWDSLGLVQKNAHVVPLFLEAFAIRGRCKDTNRYRGHW